MRLYLAVAVLMLAFVAYTEAQDAEQTLEERFSQFSQTMSENVKTAFDQIKNSDLGAKAKSFFEQALEAVKAKYAELSQ